MAIVTKVVRQIEAPVMAYREADATEEKFHHAAYKHSAIQRIGSERPARWEQRRTKCQAMGLSTPDFEPIEELLMVSEQGEVNSRALPGATPPEWTSSVDTLLKA